MKRKNNLAAPILAILFFVTACSCNFTDWVKTGQPQNNSTNQSTNAPIIKNSDTAHQAPNAVEKTGITECDEFINYIEENSEEIGKDSMVARGLVEFYKQMIYDKLRNGVSNSTPQEKADFAKQCTLALEKLKEQNVPKNSN